MVKYDNCYTLCVILACVVVQLIDCHRSREYLEMCINVQFYHRYFLKALMHCWELSD